LAAGLQALTGKSPLPCSLWEGRSSETQGKEGKGGKEVGGEEGGKRIT